MPDMIIQMGQIPGISKGMCAPAWFVDSLRDPWWPLGEGCGWWNQIQKCGLLGYQIDHAMWRGMDIPALT